MPNIVPLRPGFWLVETELREFAVRGAVVAGREGAVVWDTLARPGDMEGVLDLVEGIPFMVIYSHGDWDHVWGTAGLSWRWAEIVAQHACRERFREEIPGKLSEMQASEPGLYDDVALVPPTRTFKERLTLDLGGLTLELHALPGHTPDSIVGFIPEWGVLLGGDAIENPLPFLNKESRIEVWARGLETWAPVLELETSGAPTLEPAPSHPTVIPSHGPPGGPELLRANAVYLRSLAGDGEPILPADLSPFYRETHATNQRLARDPQSPPELTAPVVEEGLPLETEGAEDRLSGSRPTEEGIEATMKSILIRRARPADVDDVQLVHTASIREGTGDHYPPEVVQVWVRAFIPANFPENIKKKEFFVAELPDGRIGAFLVVNLRTRELDSLYVAPWAKGWGLGSYLLGYGEEVARLAGLTDLWLDASLNAVPFYTRHGWEEIGRHNRVRAGVEIPVVRMEKSLAPGVVL